MKKLFPILLFSIFTATGLADDQTRQIQSALSEAGFYFGTADGKMGEETRAALRRFQIRNGLDVSGTATPETLTALKIKNSDESTQPTSPSVASRDEEQIAATAPKPEAFLAPNVRQQPVSRESDESDAPQPAIRSPIRDYFADTDLADASADEQADALDAAQGRLTRLGYYRAAPNGLPGQEMETALLRFQHACKLRLTGRLDSDTRRALTDAPPSVLSKPFRSSKNRPPGTVLRGVWVH